MAGQKRKYDPQKRAADKAKILRKLKTLKNDIEYAENEKTKKVAIQYFVDYLDSANKRKFGSRWLREYNDFLLESGYNKLPLIPEKVVKVSKTRNIILSSGNYPIETNMKKTESGLVKKPLKTERDYVNLLENIDDFDFLKDTLIEFDGTIVKLKLKGDEFHSSLSGSLIVGLAEYQKKIYHVYLTGKYGIDTKRKITPEEAKQLEIKVVVKEGCTEALIKFAFDFMKEGLNKMPADQVQATLLTIAGIVATAAVFIGVGVPAVREAFKTKRKSLALKKKQIKNETKKKSIEFLESTVNTAIESMRTVSLGILQSGPSNVEINDKNISVSNIKKVMEELAPEKPEITEEQSTVTGSYQIKRVTLDFDKDSAIADIYDVETKEPIKGIIIQPKSISDGSYKVLKTAQDKQPIKLQLIITTRNERIHKAVLDKIL